MLARDATREGRRPWGSSSSSECSQHGMPKTCGTPSAASVSTTRSPPAPLSPGAQARSFTASSVAERLFERPSRPLKNSQAAQKGQDARRRPTAAREAYSAWRTEPEARQAYPEIRRAQASHVERAAEGANKADGPFSAACLGEHGSTPRGPG